MRSWIIGAIAAALLWAAAAPGAAVGAVTGEPVCVDGVDCAPTLVCLEGIYCQATPCDPATDCRAHAGLEDSCATDAGIDGETCASRATVGASAGGRNVAVPGTHLVPGMPIPGTSVHVPASGGEVSLDLTRGFVHGQHLPNDWISHALRIHLIAADVDMGETMVGAYHGMIDTRDGEDHGTFTNVGLFARHDNPAGGAGVAVGATLLDGGLEDCHVRGGERDEVALTCQGTGIFSTYAPEA